MCYDTIDKIGKPSDKKNGKYGNLSEVRVQYQLIGRVEGNDYNIVNKQKAEVVGDFKASRIFTCMVYDQLKAQRNIDK